MKISEKNILTSLYKVYENSLISTEIYNSEGELKFANKICLDLFGINDFNDVKGINLFDNPNLSREVKERIRMGMSQEFELVYDFEKIKSVNYFNTVKRDKMVFKTSISVIKDSSSDDKIDGFMVHILDEISLDNYKRLFEVSERNMKSIINSIDQNFIFIDKDFKIKSFNDYSAKNIYNLKTGEPIKENTDFFDYAAPSKIEEFKEKILPVFEGKKFKHIEKVNSGKDTSWFEITYAPVYGINNKIIGIVYNSYDITMQKQNEEALIEVSANVSLTARMAKIANFVWYAKGDFFYWSDDFFRFFGLEPYEIDISLESFNDFLFPESYDFVKDNFHKVRKEKIVSDFEFKFRKKSGEIGFARSVASPLFDGNGNIEKIIVLLQDITSIKVNEDKLTEYSRILENENKAKDKYFSIIAHDLRSPFTGLIGLTEVLSTNLDYLSSEEVKEITTELHKSAKNIYNLLNSLLEWSRIQRGKIKYQKVEIPFLFLVEKVLDIFKNNIEIKNIKVIKTIDPDLIIFSDSYVLELVLRNLISNAVKFVDYGGIIEISSELKDSLVFVSIKDNGLGIPEKEIENIFKLDKIFTRKGTAGETGNGLGLLLCKEHLERIGGNIYLSSVEDKGSVFTFFVPKE